MRMIADMFGITVGNDLSVMQHDNTVADLISAFHVVSDDDAGDLKLSLKLQDKLVDNIRTNRIKTGRRFIIKYDFRLKCDRPGQGNAFLLTSGKTCRILLLVSVHADHSEPAFYQFIDGLEIRNPAMLS